MESCGEFLESLGRRLRGHPRQSQQIALPKQRLGNDSLGYAVAPDLLHPGAVVYSFGLADDTTFNLELIGRYGCRVHAFDPTPRALAWARNQPMPPQFSLHPFGLADRDGVADGELPVRRLTTLMDELGHGHLDVLKLDIEGAEYAVIDSLVTSGVRPTQLLIEFHHHLPSLSVALTERALNQLNELGYRIFDCQPGGHEFSLALV